MPAFVLDLKIDEKHSVNQIKTNNTKNVLKYYRKKDESYFYMHSLQRLSFNLEAQTNLTMQSQRYQHHQVEPIDFVLFFQTVFPSSLVHGRPTKSLGNL